ncbi:SDR family NAD(P)-dependent oxidoreductase [Rhodovulum adriaticum]|uniref:NAD(P)-dependent dehydrogenase (Short-subunit alcohol dehydrogenase family) n=1 Tax=Rhodovulum adriaticum TaxID=35804 RepID=A0A4R2NXH4_RHOAD|nr:SDR family NAD(P)-dependent oxidoreductase [Rhodovulum adriaticum]MBK1635648.1 3-hydroxyacyl-CoA dehydrogenase [Rhodovulum adriaticum]TCP26115.1 NAD(P)-dependent dehydrogenase (short-subunit alcohol dehydrogenase family) [Rhodovulum adriaticum]
MQISETKAIVTGGASGLGAAAARALCSAEAAVTILDRDAERGAALAGEIGAGFQPVDVTDETSVAQAIGEASSQMGGITACINCAGIATAERTLGRSGPHALDSFRRTVEINLIGSFNVLRLAAAEMAGNAEGADGCRGVIVNTASIAAFDGQKGQAAYAASKGGIASMTLPLARDLASLKIRVMAIAPGVFRTPMLEGLGQEVMDTLAADVPAPPRLGDPAEFAALVRHILENCYLNGEVIRLDGALRMQ